MVCFLSLLIKFTYFRVLINGCTQYVFFGLVLVFSYEKFQLPEVEIQLVVFKVKNQEITVSICFKVRRETPEEISKRVESSFLKGAQHWRVGED